MKKSILFKKLGIILLISQTLVGVPMLAQESILETTGDAGKRILFGNRRKQ